MTGREYLKQYAELYRRVLNKTKEINDLYEVAGGLKGIAYDRIVVKSNRTDGALDARLDRIDAEVKILEREKKDMIEAMERIKAVIARVDSRYRAVLEAKYLARKSVRQIAKDMNYSESHINNLLCAGVKKVDRILKDSKQK